MGQRGSSARRIGALVLAGFFALVQAAPAGAAGLGAAVTPIAAQPTDAKIERGLVKALQSGAVDRFVVEFAARPNLAAAARIKDRTRRGQSVYDTLRRTATTSQVAARTIVARTPGAHADSYWLTNVLLVHGDAVLGGQARRAAVGPDRPPREGLSARQAARSAGRGRRGGRSRVGRRQDRRGPGLGRGDHRPG